MPPSTAGMGYNAQDKIICPRCRYIVYRPNEGTNCIACQVRDKVAHNKEVQAYRESRRKPCPTTSDSESS